MGTFRALRLGLIGAAMLAAVAAPFAASAQALERIKAAGTLNLGFIDGVAPFSAKSGDGKVTGFGIELCQPVADAVKARLAPATLNVRFVPLKVDAVLDSVAKGEVDLLCTPTVDTLKRRATVSYSLPVFNGGIGVLLRADAPLALRAVLNGKVPATGPIWRATVNRGLANHTYAVRAGTVTEDWVREKTRQLGVSVNVITVDDDAKGVETGALAPGRRLLCRTGDPAREGGAWLRRTWWCWSASSTSSRWAWQWAATTTTSGCWSIPH